MSLVAGLVLLAATAVAGLRWLRVCQREHYLPGSVVQFAWRWATSTPLNAVLFVLLWLCAGVGVAWWPDWLIAAALLVVWPIGLGLRGRTGPLTWTARVKRLATVTAVLVVAIPLALVPFGLQAFGLAVAAVLAPLLVDTAALIMRPIEQRMLGHFVDEASERLARVDPTVVAITGSYGKTSTKEYLRAVLGQSLEVCPSPASFNNRAGLARAINEHLHEGAQVFIAEMGTYGPGEIRDLCAWVTPKIGVITSIGPVHLERMRTLETVVQAKREILEHAEVAVLNVDDERLADLAVDLAGEVAESGLRVVRCGSTAADLDVRVTELARDEATTQVRIEAGGTTVEATAPEGGLQLTNLACAVGAALAVGLDPSVLAAGVADIHAPAHRQSVERGPSGIWVIDDSFNSNPAGARSALTRLMAIDTDGRRVIVTPGMVELGPIQHEENRAFAEAASAQVDDLVIVTRTNRRALTEGASGGKARVHWFPHRDAATEWVRAELRDGDAVLYENDLPDIFP